jgi:membrane peptidoglycan carboxypeptidase
MALHADASAEQLGSFLRQRLGDRASDDRAAQRFYQGFSSGRFTLSDLGYLAGVHPLELWTAAYLQAHPGAPRSELVQASGQVRQQAYDWLFRTHHAARQNERIRILLEQKAFQHIADDWHRQGYPFRHLVPSLATAIGTSGDRPDALAELMGIVSAGGLRLPQIDLTALRFAGATPYATDMGRKSGAPERVLEPEVAAFVRHALAGAVERGTAQRLQGGYLRADGSPLPVGGKTGTGDNRYASFGRGHRLIESRAVSRSATFAFVLGDRHFGVVTIYVEGAEAARFQFTSALAVQLLRALAPALTPLIEGVHPGAISAGTASGSGVEDVNASE